MLYIGWTLYGNVKDGHFTENENFVENGNFTDDEHFPDDRHFCKRV